MGESGYSIGYVSNITKLPQSVLRYWESVIEVFNPYKTEGGTRRYTDEDIQLILEIKKLLYEQKMTIAGANKILNNPQKIQADNDFIKIPRNHFMQLMFDLEEILNYLKSN